MAPRGKTYGKKRAAAANVEKSNNRKRISERLAKESDDDKKDATRNKRQKTNSNESEKRREAEVGPTPPAKKNVNVSVAKYTQPTKKKPAKAASYKRPKGNGGLESKRGEDCILSSVASSTCPRDTEKPEQLLSSNPSFTFPEDSDDDNVEIADSKNVDSIIQQKGKIKESKKSSSNRVSKKGRSTQAFINWNEEQGKAGSFENDKHNVKNFINNFLFARVKFITKDSELDYKGMILL